VENIVKKVKWSYKAALRERRQIVNGGRKNRKVCGEEVERYEFTPERRHDRTAWP